MQTHAAETEGSLLRDRGVETDAIHDGGVASFGVNQHNTVKHVCVEGDFRASLVSTIRTSLSDMLVRVMHLCSPELKRARFLAR